MGDEPLAERRFTLKELGIVQDVDSYGRSQLSIAIPPNANFGSAETRAVFSQDTKSWVLAPTARTKWADSHQYTAWTRTKGGSNERPKIRPVEWTRGLPHTDHVDVFLYDIDWSKTPLGPLETWPFTLQVHLNSIFADTQSAAVYWGPQLCTIYNSHFIKLASDRIRRPGDLMGVPFNQMWPEIWDDFKPMMDAIAERGVGSESVEVVLFPIIDGYPQETFFSGNFQPLRDQTGETKGFYNQAREITKNVLTDRRNKVLGAIAAKPHLEGDYVYQHIINALGVSERDFPMSFIYSATEDNIAGTCKLKLQCSRALPASGHPLVPEELELYDGHVGYTPLFRRAKGDSAPLSLHMADGSLDPQLIDGFHWVGFGEPSRDIAIIPLLTSDRLLAILVVGLNPRRPYDSDCDDFLQTIARQCSSTVAFAVDREAARLRAERLTRQLQDSEKQIREIAEFGPVGIARVATSGKLIWANDQFYSITGHSKAEENQYKKSFIDLFHADDKEASETMWQRLVDDRENINAPLRLARTWKPPHNLDSTEDENQPVWILVSAYPIVEGSGVKAAAIAVTDISRFKWAETVQSRVASAAKEAKRLQENFIDIISHEMRNPLSAITQLSDGVSMSLDDFRATKQSVKDATDIISSNVDSAKTILLCAAHQKRIIDDVLTLSKLDSMMLSITPVVVQPYAIVESTLRMFEGEFNVNHIRVESTKHHSYTDLKVDWVCLDPSRLTQIFINLITNAIKFTKTEETRVISIEVGAGTSRPPSLAGVKWFPTNKKYKDLTTGPEWGNGEAVFICFEVQDTGRGLEQSEMTKLFGRFQQATEKTHIKYGGSGLGLFISRELTETQGGEIGVRSERGKGTTFAFYIKGRRARRPSDPAQMLQPLPTDKTPRQQNDQSKEQDAQMVDAEDDPVRTTVLLVEDNVINARVLTKQLQRENCEVHVANHGMEALDVLRKTRAWHGTENEEEAITIDVILMDMEMPIMDGLTCTRRIRQLEKEGTLAHQLIVAITANARKEQIDAVMKAGSDDVLPKPFRVRECMEKIRNIVAKSGRASQRIDMV